MSEEAILEELQRSFDSDLGVSQQLLDNIKIIFSDIDKIKEILNSEYLVYDEVNDEFVYLPYVVNSKIQNIKDILESTDIIKREVD